MAVVDRTDKNQEVAVEALPRPADTQIVVHDQEGQIAFEIPAVGIWKGSKGIMVFAVMMIYYGWLMVVLQYRTHQKTIIMEIPLVFLYAILPLMGIMMLIRAIQVVYQDIVAQRAQKDET